MASRRAREPDSNPDAPKTASSIKFVQITGNAQALYGLDDQGRVFLYDDREPVGWFQLEGDDNRELEEDPE